MVWGRWSCKRDLVGTESERQLDLLVKYRDVSSTGKHHWADVGVVGEHKASHTDRTNTLLQLPRHVRDIFAMEPIRCFVHGYFLLGSSTELYVFDRSEAYSAATFDIHAEVERFIRDMSGYALMSDEELGLDMFVRRCGARQFVTVIEHGSTKRRRLELGAWPIIP